MSQPLRCSPFYRFGKLWVPCAIRSSCHGGPRQEGLLPGLFTHGDGLRDLGDRFRGPLGGPSFANPSAFAFLAFHTHSSAPRSPRHSGSPWRSSPFSSPRVDLDCLACLFSLGSGSAFTCQIAHSAFGGIEKYFFRGSSPARRCPLGLLDLVSLPAAESLWRSSRSLQGGMHLAFYSIRICQASSSGRSNP